VLSTRIYRGAPPPHAPDAGIEFVALDGEVTLERVAAYEMSPIYTAEAAEQAQQAAAAAAEQVAEQVAEQAAAAAAEGLEGLDLTSLELTSLELMAANVSNSGLEAEQQARLQKVRSGSLTSELGLPPRSPLSVSDKLQQSLLLSPRAAALQAMQLQQAVAGGYAATGGWLAPQPDLHELPPEEEMTADIFDLG
jgi:hypothetical protein